MDTRWARTWKPDESKSSGRRAKAGLIIKGFTDPDLLDIESHSPTLSREGFLTVLQSVCSHGHKLQFGDVQQAFNTGDPIKREQPLFVSVPPDGGEPREVWVQLLKTVNRLADGTREWRNCFLATARGIGFEASVLETCVVVLRGSQQRYHGFIGVAVDDIACGRDEVWEQAISKLKKRFTFGRWGSGNGKFCSREVVQAADGSLRVGQLAYIKSLDFVPLGKMMRKEQPGDANETEKVAMGLVLGVLGYLARESRPDLSGPVSILQSRPRLIQISHCLFAGFLWIKLVLCLTEMPVVEAYVPIKRKPGSLLVGLAAPVTPVSWRSHRMRRVAASLCSGGHGFV